MRSMESIARCGMDEHFDVPLDDLFNYKLSGEKEMEGLSQGWPFMDDLENDRYLQSPLSGEMLPVECNGMDAIHVSELLDNLGGFPPTVDPGIAVAAEGIRSPSSKSCTSDTDSQYDSGVGESLSGEDSECLGIPGSSPQSSSPDITGPSVNEIHSDATEVNSSITIKEEEVTQATSSKAKREARRYNLRTSSVINRIEIEEKKHSPRQSKPKLRPAPLSKYRRKTANARERGRMTEINEAFNELQEVIPELPQGKLTKITTLKLAMDYITALRELLAGGEDQGQGKQNNTSGCSTVMHQSDVRSTGQHQVQL